MSAQATWQDARKTRGELLSAIKQLKEGGNNQTEEAQLLAIDAKLKQLRLHATATIFIHFKEALELKADEVLWQAHSFVVNAYRTLIKGLQGQQHIVTKRKVEKLYRSYLKTALDFYKAYFQRLWALFDLPQLARIGQLLRLEYIQVDQRPDVANFEDEGIQVFHAILVHLGDLSRYRQQARDTDKKSRDTDRRSADDALLYYALAKDIRPSSGLPHHQMGIVWIEAAQHLQVVYYLYRSLTAEEPHPMAKQNLETEFKQLLAPSENHRKSGPPDPNEAFSSWFVRLHARFSKGEKFTQHVELEETFLHQLEMKLKKSGTMPTILKMVLINISAYQVARSNVENTWTLAASASCQFILRLNIRCILMLVRLLQSELQEVAKAAPPVEDGKETGTAPEDSASSEKFDTCAENILPLLRIYTAWLYVYRVDIVTYEEHLEPYIYDMYRGLAQALTTLANQSLMAKNQTGKTYTASPYLLPEDIEALGLKLDDLTVPQSCRLHHLQGTSQWKPHPEDRGLPRNSPEEESMSRIHDLIHCASSLAFDAIFPLALTTATEGSSPVVTIVYVEGGKATHSYQEPVVNAHPAQPDDSVTGLEGRFGNLQASQENEDDDATPRAANTTNGSAKQSNGRRHTTRNSGSALRRELGADSGYYNGAGPVDADSDFSVDPQMYNMVERFLTPPPLPSERKPGYGRQESSYGMHLSTADEVLGALPTQGRDPRSASGKEFPTLPWEFFIDHTPQHDAQRGVGATNNFQPTHYYAGSPTNQQASQGALSLNQPAPGAGNGFRPQPDNSMLFASDGFGTHGSQYGQVGSGFPSRPSTGFSGTNQGNLGDSGHVRQRFGGSTNSNETLSFQGLWSVAGGYQVTPGRAPNHSNSPQVPPGFGAGNAPFSTAFSPNATGLPPVNSPWGLPAPRPIPTASPQEFMAYHHQLPQQLPGSRSGSSLVASSHYSQPDNVYQSTVCNGNIYDATTAFGRGYIATKDDPTHFRNAVKGTNMEAAVEAADAYDRAILESALMDDPPRSKR